jgi:hypothetical protein
MSPGVKAKKPPPRSTPINAAGKAVLRAVRAVPIVRDKVIPWLVREDIDQIPSAPIVALMRRELERVAKARGDIMVGPWLSEVGFELLYWIPFLTWAIDDFQIDPSRLVAVSRGGVASWYGNICRHYVDLFDLYTVDEYREANETRWQAAGNQKQYEIGAFDKTIAARVAERRGTPVAGILHPSIMYRLLRFFWYEKAPVSLLHKHTSFRPLPKPALPADRWGLPDRYTAVRFYFRPSFPDTPENRALVQEVVHRLAEDGPVVLLNPGLRLDDHADVDVAAAANVYQIDHAMTPRDNLAVQTAIIAGADALVGTYGGLSYLGPYLGVPTVGLYSHGPELVPAHLDITWRLSQLMSSPLTVLSVDDIALLSRTRLAAGAAVGALAPRA